VNWSFSSFLSLEMVDSPRSGDAGVGARTPPESNGGVSRRSLRKDRATMEFALRFMAMTSPTAVPGRPV
jgi:hypothetical protein